ncbi:unnamed protein product [Rotaria magnacalcarata]|uniref:Uncharacterized protein n=1 Tax=Rotaria magnacalcarata TaxID=392030 RepID=A0A8S2SM54_9BILA|nr:unnamed protein product [Rotaria magnacalcarata]CAF5177298.1 unnamed protein product [Rotaria magnacalcarata]
MTEEEKAARAAKIRETKARQQQEMEEAERRREERRKAKREQLWTSNNYCSFRISLSEDEDEDDETILSDSDGILFENTI